MADPFIGQIQMWGCTFAPHGFSFCDGATMQISSEAALFSIIATYYGGDGRSTFQLPNLQGRVPLGAGSGPGLNPYAIGQYTGYSDISLNEGNMPSHTHSPVHVALDLSETNVPGVDTVVGLSQAPGGEGGMFNELGDDPVPMSDLSLSRAGLSASHENRQPYLVLNFCIARLGYYPSRN
jgi:microcystin-dependent protein